MALDALLGTIKTDRPLDEKFIECASDRVHAEWLNRNRDTAEDHHKLDYEDLSEEAKKKIVFSSVQRWKCILRRIEIKSQTFLFLILNCNFAF